MNINIGQKIKSLRLASDLTQEELANRSNLTKGFISQLENEKFQTSISLESLSDIVDALGITLAEFFSEVQESQVVFNQEDRREIEMDKIRKFEFLVPGSTNNQMDPIHIELDAGEEMEKRDPHSGEQFGYILKGTLTLLLNKKKHKIPKNSCFYFESDKPHQFLNQSNKPVSFLWVTTPPQM